MLVVALAPILGVSQGAVAPTRLLGSLAISSVGIGTLNWPLDKVVDADAEVALRAAQALGVNLVDTAEAYGFGRSEQLVADCVTKADGSPIIATKFAPVPWRRSSDDVVDACRASAARLGVDAIDLYQIHFPDLIQPLGFLGIKDSKDETYWEGLARCYELGLARNVGVSNYGPSLLRRAHSFLAARGVPLASNQINYSLLGFRLAHPITSHAISAASGRIERAHGPRRSAQPTLDACRELDVSVLGYFPLANGLLAGKYSATSMPKGLKSQTMRKYVVGGVTERGVTYPAGGIEPLLVELRAVAEARDKTVAQVSLNYCIAKGVVPIPGCRNAKQAEDNARAIGWELESAEIERLEAAADALGFEFNSGFKLE